MYRIWAVIISVLTAFSAQAQEVVLRHGLSGASAQALAHLVDGFNAEGKGTIVLEPLAEVTDKRRLPLLALLDDEDAWQFFETVPRYRQVDDVMRDAAQPAVSRTLLPQVAAAVADPLGRLQALPMALALPALFYNKEAFAKAGLDVEHAPDTWQAIQDAAGALADAGVACPLTTSRFAWVHMENLSAQNGEAAVTKQGRGERYQFNNLVHVKHLARLASWQKSRYFHYFGPGREGDAKFLAGECAMLTGESAFLAEVRQAPFAVGVGALPYYDDVRGARAGNVLPDGASLHVLVGGKKPEYQVAARFMAYLLRPPVQRDWVRATGFLPMTMVAIDELAASGVPANLVGEMRARLATPKKTGDRLPFGAVRGRVRAILNEEIDMVWQTDRPAKEALDQAMMRANAPSR